MKAPLLHPLLLALAAACAPMTASREPAHYPALPPSATSASALTFEPASALSATTPNCRATEPSLDNALDDDCDGRVDGADPAAPLWLALAYPRAAALQLSWQASEQAPVAITLPACADDAAFCTVKLGAETFPHGTHTLLVQATEVGASALPSALLVSVQAQGKATAYLLRIEHTGEPRAVGRLLSP
jgi:hypothetical protein